MTSLALLASAVALMPRWAAAGEIKISFLNPERYTDIGLRHVDRERHLKVLADHVQRWQGRLPVGQSLSIEVTDVDLAGELRPWGFVHDMRWLNGRIDGPRIDLRWNLSEGGRTLSSGQETLRDPNYLMRPAWRTADQNLPYDRRLLEDWFRDLMAQAVSR